MADFAGRYSEDLQDRFGNAFRNATVAVQTTGGSAVTLYADRTKTAYTPPDGLAANETKSDSRGNLQFFADPGNYQIVVTPVGGSAQSAFPVSVFPDPLEPAVDSDAYRPGGTDVAVADGGTGASSAAVARTNLGLGTAAVEDVEDLPVSTAQQAALDLRVVHLGPSNGSDDTATLQAAALNVPAIPKRVLGMPGQQYLISAKIDLASDVEFIGNGASIKVLDDTAKGVSVFTILGKARVAVRDWFIDCNRNNRDITGGQPQATGEYGSGNAVSVRDAAGVYSRDVSIENVHSLNAVLYGISVRGCIGATVRGCTVDGFGDDGFEAGASNMGSFFPAQFVTFHACIARNGTNTYSDNCNGFEIEDGAHHVSVIGCLSEDNFGGGIDVHPHGPGGEVHDVVISGNICRGAMPRGIRVDTPDVTVRNYNITVTNNVVSGSTSTGITVRSSTDVTVANNVLSGLILSIKGKCDNVAVRGNRCATVEVAADTGDNVDLVIQHNIVVSSVGQGILVRGISPYFLFRPVISDNTVRSPATVGIQVQRVSDRAQITGNTISGQVNHGINCSSDTPAHIEGNLIVSTQKTTGNTAGIYVASAGSSVIGNDVTGGRYCIECPAADVLISANRLALAGTTHILLTNATRTVVGNNRISGTVRGLQGDTSDHCVLTGNIFSSGEAILQNATSNSWTVVGNNYAGLLVTFNGASNVIASNVT